MQSHLQFKSAAISGSMLCKASRNSCWTKFQAADSITSYPPLGIFALLIVLLQACGSSKGKPEKHRSKMCETTKMYRFLSSAWGHLRESLQIGMLSPPNTHLGIHIAPQMCPGKKDWEHSIEYKCSEKCPEHKQQTKHRAQKGAKKGQIPILSRKLWAENSRSLQWNYFLT